MELTVEEKPEQVRLFWSSEPKRKNEKGSLVSVADWYITYNYIYPASWSLKWIRTINYIIPTQHIFYTLVYTKVLINYSVFQV